MARSGVELARWVYPGVHTLPGTPLVRGGECVGLVQEYTIGLGNTSTWRQGERVVETRDLQKGTVIANFDNHGRWPGKKHSNHACFFWDYGPRNMTTGIATSIFVVEQFIASFVTKVQIRELHCHGHWKSGEWIDPSNNADAFFTVLS
jgi:hypothetical protein